MKKVLILHTGGTFGMQLDNSQTAKMLSPNFLENLLQSVPELSSIAEVDLKIICNLDSSDATNELWTLLAKTIHQHWSEFDGFVIIHGTDTMAWSSSALSYFLGGLTKPVVFTGSQRPLSALRSDARINIIDAVELATYEIPEVMVCFDSKVHRGTRITKYSNEHLHAFRSANAPVLGNFGVNFRLNHKIAQAIIPKVKRYPPILNIEISTQINTLTCVPSVCFSKDYQKFIIDQSKGIIIQAFGAGNLPSNSCSFWIDLCKAALEKEIPVIMVTQCKSGTVDLKFYDAGKKFDALGVVSGLDMTLEAASVKLMVMLGRHIPFTARHEFFNTPLAFECSVLK